jgi:Fic family protein
MSDKIFNIRQKAILSQMRLGEKYALSDIKNQLIDIETPSLATLRRDISELRELGFLKQSGELKSSRYELSTFGALNSPINAHEYCLIDVDKRSGNSNFNFSLFKEIEDDIFSQSDLDILDTATNTFLQKSKGASDLLVQKELERFVIELSWKSSKIEGNTYSLLDTERLIKNGLEASGHTKDEAVMILNHKKAFDYVKGHSNQFKQITLRQIEDIHRLLVEGLGVSHGLRKRQVGVTGSNYLPLAIPTQLKEAIEALCTAINGLKGPYAKAFIALIGISYIQPFEDGNKRTARLAANAILLAFNCAPLSYRNVDEVLYRESMLVFYEKNSVVSMRDIFIKQYLFACDQYLKFT